MAEVFLKDRTSSLGLNCAHGVQRKTLVMHMQYIQACVTARQDLYVS